jgi:hypothetical protein
VPFWHLQGVGCGSGCLRGRSFFPGAGGGRGLRSGKNSIPWSAGARPGGPKDAQCPGGGGSWRRAGWPPISPARCRRFVTWHGSPIPRGGLCPNLRRRRIRESAVYYKPGITDGFAGMRLCPIQAHAHSWDLVGTRRVRDNEGATGLRARATPEFRCRHGARRNRVAPFHRRGFGPWTAASRGGAGSGTKPGRLRAPCDETLRARAQCSGPERTGGGKSAKGGNAPSGAARSAARGGPGEARPAWAERQHQARGAPTGTEGGPEVKRPPQPPSGQEARAGGKGEASKSERAGAASARAATTRADPKPQRRARRAKEGERGASPNGGPRVARSGAPASEAQPGKRAGPSEAGCGATDRRPLEASEAQRSQDGGASRAKPEQERRARASNSRNHDPTDREGRNRRGGAARARQARRPAGAGPAEPTRARGGVAERATAGAGARGMRRRRRSGAGAA